MSKVLVDRELLELSLTGSEQEQGTARNELRALLAQPIVSGLVPDGCKGKNCGATDGVSHSAECIAEHEQAYNCANLAAMAAASVYDEEKERALCAVEFARYGAHIEKHGFKPPTYRQEIDFTTGWLACAKARAKAAGVSDDR